MTIYRHSAPAFAGRRLWMVLSHWLKVHTYPPRWLPPRWRNPAIGYVVAASLAVLVGGLTLLLEVAFPPLALHGTLLAVIFVLIAVNWGEGPSLLVTFIGALLLAFVALPPHFSWEIDDRSEVVGFFTFLVSAVVMNLIASQAGRARRRSERLAHQAELARTYAEKLADLLGQAHWQSEQQRRYLQNVLDVLPVGVNIVDRQEHLLQMNGAMCALWDRNAPPVGASIRTLGTGWWPASEGAAPVPEGVLTQALTTGEIAPAREVEIET